MIKKIIIGYSGHAYVILDSLYSNNIQIDGYCEKNRNEKNPFCIPYIGNENDEKAIKVLKYSHIFLGIGDNKLREVLYHSIKQLETIFPVVTHARSIISTTANIGEATVVLPGAIINANANIGVGVICNSSSIIEHECEIGDFAHIAPGAVLAGSVKVGANSFIGSNSVIKEGVLIGSNVIVGAGSVVINNIPDGKKIVGNPSRFI